MKLEFHGAEVTSDSGLLAYRELDEALELTAAAKDFLSDWRTGYNTQHSMIATPNVLRWIRRCSTW